MNAVASLLAGLFTGRAGASVGNAVSIAAQIAAITAAMAPVGLWLAGNKDGVFVTLTYGDLAFWGAVLGSQLVLVIRLVHHAPPPGE